MTDLFPTNTKVVYPAHGVGKIIDVEETAIASQAMQVYVVAFEKDKMKLRIPVQSAEKHGLRHLCTIDDLERVRRTLKSKAKTGRGMWSRRAKEYEGKINSGNIVSLAEVVRDLHKNIDDPDRSYSERMIYENALNRLAGEMAAVESSADEKAQKVIIEAIGKRKAANQSENDAEVAA